MQTEETRPVNSVEDRPAESNVDKDGNPPVPSSSDNVVPSKPVKRPTRQWAAWTREEEESFFSALRQVGKNFEKITCRVQSKNKDQVRHYYYRLVRRMNKLLGPGLCLDAKNSKDTNAAMLRWWSLLEKYSCKASKLHLKPRRFKIFVEALEHQVLKDRKKNGKKRSPPGENSSPSTSSCPHQNKSSGNDNRAVKIVVVDSQNVQKSGNGKGSSSRRNSNMGVTRSSNKGESISKSTRRRRKTGAVSAATIKRWEKAAMAGVSLVADAAEHVERTAGEKQADQLSGLTVLSVQALGCSMEQSDPSPSGQVQTNTTVKLKLQLFPIDDSTRKALEVDKHNPHLELTLSTRKKISSVLEHISRKWGSASVASGDLMLFPFEIHRENLSGNLRWAQDSVVTAAEVYAMIGSPPVFRLRYGWVNSTKLQPATSEATHSDSSVSYIRESEGNQVPLECTRLQVENEELEKHVSHHQPTEKSSTCDKQNLAAASAEANTNIDVDIVGNLLNSDNPRSQLPKRNDSCNESSPRKLGNMDDHRVRKTQILSAGEWADSLTNISVGDLLNDVPNRMETNCAETPVLPSSRCLEEVPFTCDSFDAAIAAHIYSQSKLGFSGHSTQLSSIWDAEETCDEFFHKRAIPNKQMPDPATKSVPVAGEGIANISAVGFTTSVQEMQQEAMAEDTIEEDLMDECPSEPHETENAAKDFSSLTDMYWPDSLGPLELDVPPCKYYSEDLILSDSLSGLNRLIASSLDAFQNCPFFGLDDKGPSPAAGAQGSASFAGKIGRGDNAAVQSLQA